MVVVVVAVMVLMAVMVTDLTVVMVMDLTVVMVTDLTVVKEATGKICWVNSLKTSASIPNKFRRACKSGTLLMAPATEVAKEATNPGK